MTASSDERSGRVAVSLQRPIGSDHQLARLLQIGVVLEEVVEARADKHAQVTAADLDDEVVALFEHAAEESAEHRDRLEALIDEPTPKRCPSTRLSDSSKPSTRPTTTSMASSTTSSATRRPPTSSTTTSSAPSRRRTRSSVSTATDSSTPSSRYVTREADGVEEVTRLMEARE